MPDILSAVAPALGAVEGIAEIISGSKNLKEDKAALANLQRPFYKVRDEYFQNRNIASGMASQGLPAATKDFVTSETQRGLGAGTKALLKGGGDLNMVSRLFDNYSTSINKLGAQDAAARAKNIEYFMGANKDLAGQKNIQFGLNELQPYEQKLKQLTQKVAADKAMQWGGADLITGSTSAAATAFQNQSLLNGQKNDPSAALWSKLFDNSGPKTNPYTIPSDLMPQGGMNINTSAALNGLLGNDAAELPISMLE